MDKENTKKYADMTYEQVSSWINNCDSKASILLALMGVILSIAFTSDYILNGIVAQVTIAMSLFKGTCFCDVLSSILILVILLVAIGFFIDCIRSLLLVLYARFNDSRDKDNPSISFYRSIGARSYDEFRNLVTQIDEDGEIEDKLRQVYDCSRICTDKFDYYNAGIRSLRIGLVLFAIYIFAFVLLSNL